MTVDYPEKQLLAVRSWPPDFPSGVDSRLNKSTPITQIDKNKSSYWQLIFLQSRANGCLFNTEDLPQANWRWPKDTWFQERLSHQLKDRDHRLPV